VLISLPLPNSVLGHSNSLDSTPKICRRYSGPSSTARTEQAVASTSTAERNAHGPHHRARHAGATPVRRRNRDDGSHVRRRVGRPDRLRAGRPARPGDKRDRDPASGPWPTHGTGYRPLGANRRRPGRRPSDVRPGVVHDARGVRQREPQHEPSLAGRRRRVAPRAHGRDALGVRLRRRRRRGPPHGERRHADPRRVHGR